MSFKVLAFVFQLFAVSILKVSKLRYAYFNGRQFLTTFWYFGSKAVSGNNEPCFVLSTFDRHNWKHVTMKAQMTLAFIEVYAEGIYQLSKCRLNKKPFSLCNCVKIKYRNSFLFQFPISSIFSLLSSVSISFFLSFQLYIL